MYTYSLDPLSFIIVAQRILCGGGSKEQLVGGWAEVLPLFFTSIANFWKSPLSPFRSAFSFFLVIRIDDVWFYFSTTQQLASTRVIPMAEAVGLAASIGGLVGIASQVCRLSYNYYSEVMNAQADIQQLVSEISSWLGCLSHF